MNKYLIADFSDWNGEHYAREPVIALMKDGSLVCIFVTGGPTEPHNENYVVISRSEDKGRTWAAPEVLFRHKQRGVWAVEIFTGYEYPMMSVHTYNGSDCPEKELQTFVSYTYDNGRSWTSPVSIAPYANGLSLRKGITLSNGEVLFPVYYTRRHGGFGEFLPRDSKDFWKGTKHESGVVISSDGGRSYTPFGHMHAGYDLWEPNAVEAEPGHIVMYMRDSGFPRINAAESFDYGRTWTHVGRLDMLNGNSKIDMLKVKNSVLMISNVSDSLGYEQRVNLIMQVSRDGCRTWEPLTALGAPDEHLFYPHSVWDEKNDTLYVSYENGRQHFINVYSLSELGL